MVNKIAYIIWNQTPQAPVSWKYIQKKKKHLYLPD
jgi:hypothetical protein